MKHAFRPRQRLRTPSEFARALRRRGLFRGVLLEVSAQRNDLGEARLGLVVPKRLARLAIERNSIKRVVRESFRRQAVELPAQDLVVRLHASVKGLPDLARLKLLVAKDAAAGFAAVCAKAEK